MDEAVEVRRGHVVDSEPSGEVGRLLASIDLAIVRLNDEVEGLRARVDSVLVERDMPFERKPREAPETQLGGMLHGILNRIEEASERLERTRHQVEL